MAKTNNSKRAARKAKAQRIRVIAGVCCVVVLLIACCFIGIDIYETHDRLKEDQGILDMYPGSPINAAPTAEPTSENVPVNPQATNEPAATAGDATAAPTETDAEATEPEATNAEATAQPAAAEIPAFDENGNPIPRGDFEQLLAINEHLVGWLDASDVISLPIVHHDNDYYLTHDFYGNYDDAGTVFVNEVNTVWPADKHLLLHGHNMRDGTAFGPLKDEYSKLDNLKANPVVYFRLINADDRTAYVPVAIFEASVSTGESSYFDIGNIFFDSDDEFIAYAQSAIDRSMYNLPFDVQEDDHLISLITCSYGYKNARFIVMCRELREGETLESVTQLMQTATKK